MPRMHPASNIESLIRGDSREVLKDKPVFADMAYFDPPFGTGRDFGAYNDGAQAFRVDEFDTCISDAVSFAREDLAQRWLRYLASCLVPIRGAVKPKGSFWIHVDERQSHLVRLLCDKLLAPAEWRSTVIWAYRRWPSKSNRFQSMHDVLFHYAPKGGTFNVLHDKPTESTRKKWGDKTQVRKTREDGRLISVSTDIPSLGPAMGDVWPISVIAPRAYERRDGSKFPTQKPESLLERAILSSTNPGDVVLDPGAGSGTTLAVARRLGRGFFGIDRSEVAIAACEKRLGIVASSIA